MILSDRALISSYRLSVVTMLLIEAVWSHVAMHILRLQSVPLFG